MIKIIDKNSTGKTSRLLLLAKENDGIIVCKNPMRVKEKAAAYGILGVPCFSYKDYLLIEKSTSKPVFIDEIEDFVKFLTDEKLAGYSLSLED